MSFRLLSHRLFKNGRFILKTYCKRDIHANNFLHENRNFAKRIINTNYTTNKTNINNPTNNFRNSGFLRFGQHARRLFVDNILNRVTTSQAGLLRTDATKKFLYGDSTPFFALVGVGLASGNGLLTKNDEMEGVCYEIREAVSHIQNKWSANNITSNLTNEINLDDLNIGPPIDKGCAAVVYSASLKDPNKFNIKTEKIDTNPQPKSPTTSHTNLHNYRNSSIGGSVDNLMNFNYRYLNEATSFRDQLSSTNSTASAVTSIRQRFGSISETDVGIQPYVTEQNNENSDRESKENSPFNPIVSSTLEEYPLALKMMFNYDIQSNAMSILRAMYRETVPSRRRNFDTNGEQWEQLLSKQIINLPAHPNIVLMFGVFCAQIPNLINSHSLYPMALPARLNPSGYGRNMSLFLLMKRYNCSLKDYLIANNIDRRTSILLFAQLLEAVVHLYRYGVSHRDLKSDNILLELNEDSTPNLVLSDFGCCLSDKTHGLRLSYPSADIDKGGNPALMAPEIITKEPGMFSILNYTKSDLWTCGTIAYEIFGEFNPFYGNQFVAPLRNTGFKESDLPKLPNDVPLIIRKLIENILQVNPNNRLSPDVAANVVQLYLWAPSLWLKSGYQPNSAEILQWLLSLTTKVLCEARITFNNYSQPSTSTPTNVTNGRRTYIEYLLISSFLIRARLSRIRKAISWIQDVVTNE